MTYDWEQYKDIIHRVYVEEKQSLRKLLVILKDEHGFEPSLRGLYHKIQQWKFSAVQSRPWTNDPLVARVKELWETNHSVRDMVSILTDEGFDIHQRAIKKIRLRNGWFLRSDAMHYAKERKGRAATGPGASPEEDLDGDSDGDDGESESVDGQQHSHGGIPDSGNVSTPDAATLKDAAVGQADAEALQEARKAAFAAEAEEKRVTKKRRRWLHGRAGLPADPPGPPRFPSELSLGECKVVLQMDAAIYKDVRAKFRAICVEEGVIKKTIAGPQKWEAVKLRLVRESMHLRGVFWDRTDAEQKERALDLICGDVTKEIRQQGSRMGLQEARNILGLNPQVGREVRFRFQQILAEDRFAGKVVAGEAHWNELVARWLAESQVLGPVATSLNTLDPEYAQKKKAVEVLARDGMKRYRDAEARGYLSKMLAAGATGDAQEDEQPQQPQQQEQDDAQGETDHDVAENNTALDMTEFDGSVFGTSDATQIAAQLGMDAHDLGVQPVDTGILGDDHQAPAATETPAKRKRGRPRKYPLLDPNKRSKRSNWIPAEEAMAVYAQSQARFMPVDAADTLSTASATPGQQPGDVAQFAHTPNPAFAPAKSPINTRAPTTLSSSTPTHAQALAQSQSQSQVRAQARVQAQTQTQSSLPSEPTAEPRQQPQGQSHRETSTAPIAIYFRLHPTSTVTGVPAMWIATLASRAVAEVRQKATVRSPGAACEMIDGIVKDGIGGEIPVPISDDVELAAYLNHMQETHGPPIFSIRLVAASLGA